MEVENVGKLFVGGLNFDTTEDVLDSIFCKYGPLLEVLLMKDRETHRSRGFAFVTFENPDDAKDAEKDLNGKNIDGRTLTVEQASHGRRGGFRGGRGSFRGYGGRGGSGGSGGSGGGGGGGGRRDYYGDSQQRNFGSSRRDDYYYRRDAGDRYNSRDYDDRHYSREDYESYDHGKGWKR